MPDLPTWAELQGVKAEGETLRPLTSPTRYTDFGKAAEHAAAGARVGMPTTLTFEGELLPTRLYLPQWVSGRIKYRERCELCKQFVLWPRRRHPEAVCRTCFHQRDSQKEAVRASNRRRAQEKRKQADQSDTGRKTECPA